MATAKLHMPGRGAKPEGKASIHHLEIHEGERGGHVVEHHYEQSDGMMSPKEPEKHVFGEGDGHEMVKHMVRHAHIKGVHVMPKEEASRVPTEPEGPEGGEKPGEDE